MNCTVGYIGTSNSVSKINLEYSAENNHIERDQFSTREMGVHWKFIWDMQGSVGSIEDRKSDCIIYNFLQGA